jgi:hypothetical protein
MNRVILGLGCVGIGITSSFATAAQVIEFLPTDSNTAQIQILAMAPLGQSFTAIAQHASSITLRFVNLNMDYLLAQDRFITLTFYSGENFSFPALQSFAVDVDAILGRNRGAEGDVTFQLGNLPTLVGNRYSFQLQASTTRYGVGWSGDGGYAGGNAIQFDNPTGADLHFNLASNVPEPSGGALMLLGLLPIVYGARTRARSLINAATPTA